MISPPLDIIPKLPPKGVAAIMKQINKLIADVFENLDATLEEAIKLPEDCKCDDPRIQSIKDKLDKIQKLIGKLQELIPIIDKIQKGIAIASKIAAGIKAAALLTPVVGQAALLAELVNVQNATIASAIQSVSQLRTIPSTLQANVTAMALKIAQVANKIGQACPGEELSVSQEVQDQLRSVNAKEGGENVGKGDAGAGGVGVGGSGAGWGGNWLLISGDGSNGAPIGTPPDTENVVNDGFGSIWQWQGDYYNPNGIGWGEEASRQEDATLGTEFYSQYNVSDDDINSYVTTIDKLVSDQENLLASLQEAPAQSYNGDGPPDSSIGKLGDYYIDTANKVMYGPKMGSDWNNGINY